MVFQQASIISTTADENYVTDIIFTVSLDSELVEERDKKQLALHVEKLLY